MSSSNNRGCFAALLGIFGSDAQKREVSYPYRLRDDFLSTAELSFYRVLNGVVGGQGVVLAKVGLSDLLFVQQPNQNYAAFGRISQKHADFVVCDPQTMKPLLAIELDDSSHKRSDRQERDDFVNKAFAAAGLPLLRFDARSAYRVREVLDKIGPLMGPRENRVLKEVSEPLPTQSSAGPAAGPSDVAPACPKCGETMVLRTSAKGPSRGEQFYGCPNFPRCRTILPKS